MILIVGGAPHYRNALQHILQRGPIPVRVCATCAEVGDASATASESVSLIFYNADDAGEEDLIFLRDIRAGRYEIIRRGVPFLFAFNTMSRSLMKQVYALDAITVERPAPTETLTIDERAEQSGWRQTTQSPLTLH